MITSNRTNAEAWLLSLPPSSRQTRWVVALAIFQLAAFALLVPFANIRLAQIDGFIPAFEGVIFVTSLITSVLLFSQFAIYPLRALLVLACGYLFSALIIIPHALAFPGAFSPTGLFRGFPSTEWLYLFQHLFFPLALLGYGLIKDEKSGPGAPRASLPAVIARSVALVLALVGGLTLFAAAGYDRPPVVWVFRMLTLVSVSALAVLWLRRRSALDQWLMVVALAAILELGTVFIAPTGRFSVWFYSGRMFALFTSTIVLVVLLVETTQLYASAARSSEAKIRRLVDANIIGIFVAGLEGQILEANDAFLRMLGYDREDLAGARVRWTELTPPEWHDRDKRTLAELNSTGIVQPFEKEYFRKDGSRVPVLIGAALFEGGGSEGVAFVLDLTERKRAEGALKQSETRYQNLFQAMAVSFFELDYTGSRQILRALRDAGVRDFRGHFKENPRLIREIMRATHVVDVNDQTVALFGRGNKEELLTSVEAFWPDESIDDYMEAVLATIDRNDQFSIETRVRRLDGTIFDARFTLRYATDDKTKGLAGVIDITERKRAEEALRESERGLRSVIDGIPGLVVTLAPSGEIEGVNRQILEYYGQSLEELRNWGTSGVIHPEDLPYVKEVIARSIASGAPFEFEHRARRFDGEYRWLFARGVPFRDSSGRIGRWFALVTDIEERKRAEGALRESEAKFRAAIDGIAGLVAIMAPSGELESVNRPIIEYFGRSLEELKDWGTGDAVHPDDLARVLESFGTSLAAGTPFHQEVRLRRFDGEYRWFENRGAPIRDESGRITRWYCLLTDIEDRTQALTRLQQMQADFARMNRISIMGELAASLSHEITQPIASARNNARAALNFLDKRPQDLREVREALGCVVGDADRAGEIVDRIRENIKKAPPRKDDFDLNAAISEVIALARSAIINNGVSVQARFADELAPVHGDRVQLQQVVMNLILNAVEAMGSVEPAARMLLISSAQDHAGVHVAVRDSGPGIDPAHLERVFEAFYTTKSSGTGMGLSICRSIIDAHGGRLWAEANEPRGVVFQFTLPRMQGAS